MQIIHLVSIKTSSLIRRGFFFSSKSLVKSFTSKNKNVWMLIFWLEMKKGENLALTLLIQNIISRCNLTEYCLLYFQIFFFFTFFFTTLRSKFWFPVKWVSFFNISDIFKDVLSNEKSTLDNCFSIHSTFPIWVLFFP